MSKTICTECSLSFDYEDKARVQLPSENHHLCSLPCWEKWWKGRTLYRTIQLTKNIQSWPFVKFKDVFQFDVAGGYAEEKFQRALTNPHHFLVTLSIDKVVLLAKEIL